MRAPITIGAGLLAAAALAAPAGAATLPTVKADVGDSAIALSGHQNLGSGPVRLKLTRDGGDPRTIAVIELEEGRKASGIGPLGGLQDASKIERSGRLVAGITVRPGRSPALSFETRNRTYVVIDATDERQAYAEFRPDVENSGATFAANDARLYLRDGSIGLRPDAHLPRRGVIRIRNTGDRPHHALAIRLPAGTSFAEAKAALRKGRFPSQVGTATDLTGLISAGTRVDVETRLRSGRYVVASFYAGSGAGAKPDIHRGLLATARVR